jgi:hypothetical protein
MMMLIMNKLRIGRSIMIDKFSTELSCSKACSFVLEMSGYVTATEFIILSIV